MMALTLAAAGLSALLVMLVARLFPPRRVAEVLGFLTAILSILCSQSGNLYNALGHNVTISGSQVNGAFALLMRFNTPWNPLNWAGQRPGGPGRGPLAGGTWPGGADPGAFGAGLFIRPGYRRTLVLQRLGRDAGGGLQEKACPPRPGNAQPAPASESGNASLAEAQMRRLLPAPVRAILQKDFLLLRRDIRNLSQLVTPLIFGVFYTFMFLRPGGSLFPDSPDMPAIFSSISHFVSTYGNIGMSLFVGWMLLSRLSGMAFSSEGQELLDVEGLPGAQPATCWRPNSWWPTCRRWRWAWSSWWRSRSCKKPPWPSSCMACWQRPCARPA